MSLVLQSLEGHALPAHILPALLVMRMAKRRARKESPPKRIRRAALPIGAKGADQGSGEAAKVARSHSSWWSLGDFNWHRAVPIIPPGPLTRIVIDVLLHAPERFFLLHRCSPSGCPLAAASLTCAMFRSLCCLLVALCC